MFTVIYQLLRKVLNGKKCGGSGEILEGCKGEVKGTKYAVVCVAEVLCTLYTEEDVAGSATLKNIIKEFETLHSKSQTKIVTNI